ncbi:Clavaminate synthase-like protein [Pleomassaria siparia CBS 279.74]|uniref:Clavaminate synthase-like protein n=1 Tax=Pleomassaria siparia CBS 279.74 TaxID=1314801 RepID=A0A6G1JQ73_9PLEO|nr:Clavaminate synthase-like protein [Pleomassaria siparia CBS 279.74]
MGLGSVTGVLESRGGLVSPRWTASPADPAMTGIVSAGAVYFTYLCHPFYNPLEKIEDIGSFTQNDPSHRADPKLSNLLANATEVVELLSQVGTEIEGMQSSQLWDAGLDELALLAAKRGALKKIAKDFRLLYIHGWAPHPMAGSPEHMIIYDHKESLPVQWHTDQSPEAQNPGCSLICMLEWPSSGGGDRLVSSVTQELQNNSTDAVMQSKELVQNHTVVIVHPVMGEKALYVNPVYTKYVAGFDKEESNYLLGFPFDHITKRQDLQCRVRYEAGTVQVWDQRATTPSQTLELRPLANNTLPSLVEEDDGECEKDFARVSLGPC